MRGHNQLLAFVVINIAASANDGAHEDDLFGTHKALLEGFGVYQASSDQLGVCLLTNIPNVILLLYGITMRKRILAQPLTQKIDTSHLNAKTSSPYRTYVFDGPVSLIVFYLILIVAAAILSPTYMAVPFLLVALLLVGCLSLVRGRRALRYLWARQSLRIGPTALIAYVCAWGAVTASCQNALVISYIGDVNLAGSGLQAFDSLNGADRVAMRYLQFFLALLCTQLAHLIIACTRATDKDYNYDKINDSESIVPSGHHDDDLTTGNNTRVGSRLAVRKTARADSHPIGTPMYRVPSLSGTQVNEDGDMDQLKRSFATSVVSTKLANRMPSRFRKIWTFAIVARRFISRMLATICHTLLHYFLYVPALPLVCVAANIIIFPSVCSIPMLAGLWWGLLSKPRQFVKAIPGFSILKGLLLLTQFCVFASSGWEPNDVQNTFFFTSEHWLRILEMSSNTFIFVIMCATSFQHAGTTSTSFIPFSNTHRFSNSISISTARKLRVIKMLTASRTQSILGKVANAQLGATVIPPTRESLNGDHEERCHSMTFEKESSSKAILLDEQQWMMNDCNLSLAVVFEELVGREPYDRELLALTRCFDQLAAARHSTALHKVIDTKDEKPHISRWELILAFYDHSKLSVWAQLSVVLRYTLVQYAIPISLLTVFVMSTFVSSLDVLHAIVLAQFLVFICFTRFAARHWYTVVISSFTLTTFYVIFTFVDRFITVPEYAAAGIKYETIGIAPLQTQWHAIPYFIATFAVAAVFSLSRGEITTPAHMIAAFDWGRLRHRALVVVWQRRATMAIVTIVFASLAIAKDNSLLIEGLLAVLLIISIFYVTPQIPKSVQRWVWIVAVLYSAIVVGLVSALQFVDIQKRVHDIFNQYSKCSDNLRCEKDIGVLSGDSYVLTQFLAPWCVALVASFVHLTSTVVDQEENDSTSKNFIINEPKESDHISAFATPDQKAIHALYTLLRGWDNLASIASALCGECASVLVWAALYFAVAIDGNLANLMYAIFLILNLRNIFVLGYCIVHILVIYSYGFVFIPKLMTTVGSSTLASVIGIDPKFESHYAIVAPMLVFYAVLLRQCTKEAASEAKHRLPPIEQITKWISFVRYAFFDMLGYEMFLFASLGTLVYTSNYISGLVSALLVAITVSNGRYRFLTNRLARAPPYFLTVCLFFYQMAGLLNDRHGLWDNSIFGKWWDYIHPTDITQVHVGAFFGIISMHLANDWQLLSVQRYGRLINKGLIQPTLVEHLRQQNIRSLSDLGSDEFESVVPISGEAQSESCMAKANQFVINVFFLLSPFAIASFVAGVAAPSILNLTLVSLGLSQLLLRREIFWEFNWLWPRIYVPYYIVLIAFPLIASPTVVADWIRDNPTLTDVIGLSVNGDVLRLSWGQAVALFVAALQTRIFEEYGYEACLRKMQYQYKVESEKHQRLIKRFKDINAAELEEAQQMQNDLWERLQKIRDLTRRGEVVTGTEKEDAVAEEREQEYASKPLATSRQNTSSASNRGPPADAEFGTRRQQMDKAARQLIVDMGMMDSSEQARRNHIVNAEAERWERMVEREGKEFAALESGEPSAVPVDTELGRDSSVNTPRQGIPLREQNGGSSPHDEEETGDTNKLSFKDRLLETLSKILLDLMLRMYSVSLVGAEDPNMKKSHISIRFFTAVLFFVERYLGDFVILFAFANFLSSSSMWDAVPCFVLLIFAVPWYPFPPAAVFDFVAVFLLVGVVIKTSIPLITAHVTLSSGLSIFLSTLFVKVPRGDDGNSIPTDISTVDVALDFLVFALILALQAICSHNGTHPPRKRFGQQGKEKEREIAPILSATEPLPLLGDDQQPLLLSQRLGHEDANSTKVPISVEEEMEEAEEEEVSKSFFIAYFANIFQQNGVGMDLYSLMFLIDIAAILAFTFTYYFIQGSASGSIITSVQNNLLPGPYVLVVFILILLMIADRVCYITRSLQAKWALTVVVTLSIMIGYVCWVQSVEPSQQSLGLAFFLVKLFYVFVSCVQLRKGYAIERRHDPFTHDHEGILLWIGYQAYRAVPFLWELRVTIDWSCEVTALRFPWYLVVEDMYDIIYNRHVAIADTVEQQPVFGSPITFGRKVLDGFSRIIIMIFVIVFPLFYYSSFNPASVANGVSSAVVTVSFDQSSTIFESSIVSIEPYPGNLGRWLQNTRPGLRAYDAANPQKSSQLINLGSCSNDLWGISPQGLRRMNDSLASALANQSAVTLNLQLEIQRIASTGDSASNSQLLISSYQMPYNSAQLMYQALNADLNATSVVTVQLPNFYRPIILNQPSQAIAFDGAEGDNVDCTMQLRTELDVNLQTMVRYWCLKCNSLFTYSNFPNASFPEWNCLTQGIGCDRYNFEKKSTVYTPTSMYFAVISDRIPETLSFLPNIGIVALYTTFVLAVGRVFRSIVSGSAQQAMYQYMADPEPVDKLVRYIYVARAFRDLMLEESLFFELIDLLRSPEALLTITKQFPKHFRDVSSEATRDVRK